MYVTRPLSLFKKNPEAVSALPPEGPNSGYLVIADKEWEDEARRFWGLFKDNRIRDFPFPQNRILAVEYTQSNGQSTSTYRDKVLFVPVIGQPLSANRYYAIRAQGKHKGKACTCSTEEDMGICCICTYIKDVKPQPFDLTNIYQRMQIRRRSSGFVARSVVENGFPPLFLRRKGWRLHISSSQQIPLQEANGVDFALRNRHPDFEFPGSDKRRSSAVVAGRWYCPFMFIKEDDTTPKDQMEKSPFYEITLERYWEQIYVCDQNSHSNPENTVTMNTSLQIEVVRLFGEEVMAEDIRVGDGWARFRTRKSGAERNVGLSSVVLDSMRAEAKRGGWVEMKEKQVRIERADEFKGNGGWSRYGSYVLVERFVLRRIDGSLVLAHDFRHSHQVQSKWE
ncbi:hypothetical protein H6P81_008649 [Aristolochia fimbriata]|uniref:Uncharacterized protein n=1 Tax=Aristolochia fimbriata TaxID=158543 RepID=A0AAV7EJC1_ARIFI|nr:hypothetical protein H6P81_008649 [Aristolochia fimbriata]